MATYTEHKNGIVYGAHMGNTLHFGEGSGKYNIKLWNGDDNALSLRTDKDGNAYLYYGTTPDQPNFYFSPSGSADGEGTRSNPYRNVEDVPKSKLEQTKAYRFFFEESGTYTWKSSNRLTLSGLTIQPYGDKFDMAIATSNGAGAASIAMSNADYTKPVITMVVDDTYTRGGKEYDDPRLFTAYNSATKFTSYGIDWVESEGNTGNYHAYRRSFFGQAGGEDYVLAFTGNDITICTTNMVENVSNVIYYHGLCTANGSLFFLTIDNRSIYTVSYGFATEAQSANNTILGGVYNYYEPYSRDSEMVNHTQGVVGQVRGNVVSATDFKV